MKQRNYVKTAALVLAVVMLLGLTACGGGSGSQVQHSDLVGKWASEEMTLYFKADLPEYVLVSFDNSDMYYGYSYTVEDNVLKVEIESMESVLEVTVESDRLVSGNLVFTKLPDDSGSQPQGGGQQAYQPPVNEPVTPAEPVQTAPPATDPPAVSTDLSGWYGVWDSGNWLLEINPDYALAYNIDNAEDEFDESVCISDIWDCDYVMDGNTMKMDCYDMAGNLMESLALTLEGGYLCNNGDPVFLKHTNNTGISDNMEGTWYAMPNAYFKFESGWDNASGDIITFYGDGTCLIQWSEGSSETHDGYYQMTTKFENPAIRMVLDGLERGTYEYEFISNDLLMIYTDNERCYGYLLYRK